MWIDMLTGGGLVAEAVLVGEFEQNKNKYTKAERDKKFSLIKYTAHVHFASAYVLCEYECVYRHV